MSMPMIDRRGRLFGRLNLVDAAVGVLVLVLLPAAYGAYVLFKEPPAALTEIAPARVRREPNVTMYLHGRNFRPYMRVSFNDTQADTFVFASPTTAAVHVPDLPPGQYDIVLYDYMQEVSRLRKALTIDPAPSTSVTVELDGALTSLSPEQARALTPGQKISGAGAAEILTVGTPEPEVLHIRIGEKETLHIPASEASASSMQVPVRLKTQCEVKMGADGTQRCSIRSIVLAPDVNVPFEIGQRTLNFRISDVRQSQGRASGSATK
jgi:hypothetical protein